MAKLWTHACPCGTTVNAAESPKGEITYLCPGCGKVVTVKPQPAKEK